MEVKLLDDLDGSKADETVAFALDGVGLDIDVSQKNAAELSSVLADFVASAGGRAQRSAARPARAATGLPVAGRRIKRIELAERGRIPVNIVEQFDADQRADAHASAPRPAPAQHADAVVANPQPSARTVRRTAKKATPATNNFSAAG